MTLDEIRDELLRIADDQDRREVSDLRRARSLVSMIIDLGLSPRKVGLSLRQLGLNPRTATRGDVPSESRRRR